MENFFLGRFGNLLSDIVEICESFESRVIYRNYTEWPLNCRVSVKRI